ncbi:hypothetical protein BW721_06660 [Jeotgalibaca sp. PTS2502]|uniref:M15 family metallopeptidase n=1 Tax=Jeotgalibaca sp. PTS2502 TaxID=1903686 RepID=UPI000973827D|nr:M15 family metallopeptidase [Jeotgalibaca sp. PTS2502]APZ49385.1 hypothetical protein BW721_06660 [Jeotgalibaca sp. PTS2502]
MAGKHRRKKRNRNYLFTILIILILGATVLHSCQNKTTPNQEISIKDSQESEVIEEETTSETGDITVSEKEQLEQQLVPTPEASVDDWNLILVNRENQLSANPDFDHYITDEGKPIDSRMADAYEQMMADGRAAGMEFILISGYRSIESQQLNYDSVYQTYIDQGYSSEEATSKTEAYIALPNASEHSTGLAVDITEPTLASTGDGLVEAFEEIAEGQWLANHAADYGFILRYPKGKEAITFIAYEPWHFRYVGVENALYIKENDLTLEEYIALLKENDAIRQKINELE